jgi:hypothetical protein
LLKQTILKFGTGARWFVSHGAERNLTLHVGEGEEVTFIGLDDVLVETGSRLGTKLITRVYVLGWRTLTSHVRGSAIKHGVGSAITTVESAGLGVYKNFISRFDWRDSTLVLNLEKARLKLIRHLLLHENIYLTIGSATSSHTTTTSGTPNVPIRTETRESFELNTTSIGAAVAGVTLAHRGVLATIESLGERCLVSWNFCHGVGNKLPLRGVAKIPRQCCPRTTSVVWDAVTRVAADKGLHTGVIARLQTVRGIRKIRDENITHRVILRGHLTHSTFCADTVSLPHHPRLIKNVDDTENGRT